MTRDELLAARTADVDRRRAGRAGGGRGGAPPEPASPRRRARLARRHRGARRRAAGGGAGAAGAPAALAARGSAPDRLKRWKEALRRLRYPAARRPRAGVRGGRARARPRPRRDDRAAARRSKAGPSRSPSGPPRRRSSTRRSTAWSRPPPRRARASLRSSRLNASEQRRRVGSLPRSPEARSPSVRSRATSMTFSPRIADDLSRRMTARTADACGRGDAQRRGEDERARRARGDVSRTPRRSPISMRPAGGRPIVAPLRDAYLDGAVGAERRERVDGRLATPAADQYVLVAEDAGTLVGFGCAYGAKDDPRWRHRARQPPRARRAAERGASGRASSPAIARW